MKPNGQTKATTVQFLGAIDLWRPSKHHLPGVKFYDSLWSGLPSGLPEYDVRTVFVYAFSNMPIDNIKL